MVIDTKSEASTLRTTKMFVIIVFALLVMVTAALLTVDIVVKLVICGALSVLFLTFYWYQYNMKYTYFYFSNNGKNLIFKFYSMQFFFGKPRTVEVAKINFEKYEIVTDFFGKRDSLVLFQKTPKGIAKYPPISLTLLSKKQKKELEQALIPAR